LTGCCRLREPLQNHFQACAHLYGIDGSISKIDIRPVVDGYERVVDYVFKTMKRGRVPYDEAVLILPRTRDQIDVEGHCTWSSRPMIGWFRRKRDDHLAEYNPFIPP
jgi:hypothetical protein